MEVLNKENNGAVVMEVLNNVQCTVAILMIWYRPYRTFNMIDQYDDISLICPYLPFTSPVTGHTSYTVRITPCTYFAFLLAASLGSSSACPDDPPTESPTKKTKSSKAPKSTKSTKSLTVKSKGEGGKDKRIG